MFDNIFVFYIFKVIKNHAANRRTMDAKGHYLLSLKKFIKSIEKAYGKKTKKKYIPQKIFPSR